MSKLADLLNPAPSSAPPRPPPVHVPPPSHRRNESITSPLEALALAATTAPPLDTSITAVALPASSVPPNPYAINSNFPSPPAAATFSHPPPTNPYATSAPQALSPQSQVSRHILSNPSPSASEPQARPQPLPSLTEQQPTATSTQPIVKTEMSDEPAVASTAASNAPTENEQTVKTEPSPNASTLTSAIPPLHTKDSDMNDESNMPGIQASVESAPPVAPVRAPKKPVQKKGTAKKANTSDAPKKAAPRKRKLEPESSKDATPFSQRSDTPASRVSKTPARKNSPQQSSPPPSQDNASVADEDADGTDYVDGDQVFCVCRKPDDHTWMIGCDGGCDDWFHGHCVDIKERDSELIDKYVCPDCETAGRGKTMWKPMCRLDGCRAPARVSGKNPSKYCSDEHGKQFMREKAYGKNWARAGKDETARKRRKQAMKVDEDVQHDDASSDDGHQAHLRGGVIRPGELKALVSGTKNIEEFKRLGQRIATPDTTENMTDPDGDIKMADGEPQEDTATKLQLNAEDQVKYDAMLKKKAALESQLQLLGDKERFFTMVRKRHKSVLEELKKKEAIKDICGFDSRLTWSEPEFDDWRQSDEGKLAFKEEKLGPPTNTKDQNGASANGTAKDDDDEIGKGVCKKKRCERHKQWAKMEQNEINLARSQCWHNMRKLESEEAGLKERAMLRQLEAGE